MYIKFTHGIFEFFIISSGEISDSLNFFSLSSSNSLLINYIINYIYIYIYITIFKMYFKYKFIDKNSIKS